MDTSLVGKIARYEHEPRAARFVGLVTDGTKTPGLILKYYYMHLANAPSSDELVAKAQDCLVYMIQNEQVDPQLGLGFAILSRGNLNIATWGIEDIFVPVNKLLSFDGNLQNLKVEDVNVKGAFCAWEMGIVAYECRAWLNYLKSAMGPMNKEAYLIDHIEGPLMPKLD